jgi:hypothetical protein
MIRLCPPPSLLSKTPVSYAPTRRVLQGRRSEVRALLLQGGGDRGLSGVTARYDSRDTERQKKLLHDTCSRTSESRAGTVVWWLAGEVQRTLHTREHIGTSCNSSSLRSTPITGPDPRPRPRQGPLGQCDDAFHCSPRTHVSSYHEAEYIVASSTPLATHMRCSTYFWHCAMP